MPAESKTAIHYSRCQMVPTPSSLAAQLGLLGEMTAACREAVFTLSIGDFDHAEDGHWLRHAGTTKPLWARADGADTKLIGFSWHRGAMPIYARPESGITQPADLKGRRIAMVRVVNQPFDVERAIYLKPFYIALAHSGLRLADVEIVDTVVEREHTQNAAPRAKNIFVQIGEIFAGQIRRRAVDAIATNLPPETVRALGLRPIYDGRSDTDPEASRDLRGLVVSGPLLRERRDVLVEIVSALIAAGEWAKTHPNEAMLHLATDLALPEAALRARGIDAAEIAQIGCTADHVEALRRKQTFLLETGMIAREVALDEWIDSSILRDARIQHGAGQAGERRVRQGSD